MMTATETQTTTNTRHMPMYRVLLHNDDVTTFEFVIGVLVELFGKKIEDALRITQEVHKTGIGLAGVYALEHAEVKVEQTHSIARAHKFPLTLSIEPVE